MRDSLVKQFPSPTEVNRLFYGDTFAGFKEADEFPAPFEVDRFLYKMKKLSKEVLSYTSFRPLSR